MRTPSRSPGTDLPSKACFAWNSPLMVVVMPTAARATEDRTANRAGVFRGSPLDIPRGECSKGKGDRGKPPWNGHVESGPFQHIRAGSRSTVKTAVVHDGVAFGYAHCDAAKRNGQDRSPGA